MDVDQLFQKRSEPDDRDEGPPQKLHKGADSQELEILEALRRDQVDTGAIEDEVYDDGWLTKLMKRLDKSMVVNQELREKYPHDASKFADSEFELKEAIKMLSSLAIQENSLVPKFCDTQTAITLLSLVKTHPNADIVDAIIEILYEFTSGAEETEESWQKLSELFARTKFTNAIGSHLVKLDALTKSKLAKETTKLEAKDRIGLCFNLLSDLAKSETLNADLVADSAILDLTVNTLQIKGIDQFDELWQHSSEFLFTLVDNTCELDLSRVVILLETNTKLLDSLLVNISNFAKFTTIKESIWEECVSNVFNSVIRLLSVSPEARESFIELEGIQLMLLICEKHGGTWILSRVFSVLAAGTEFNFQVSQLFVLELIKNGGLKKVFKYLKQNCSFLTDVLKLIASFFRLLDIDSDERVRVLNKLHEKDYQKFQRLLAFTATKSESSDDDDVEEIVNHAEVIIAWCLIDAQLGKRFRLLVTTDDQKRIRDDLRDLQKARKELVDGIDEDETGDQSFISLIRSYAAEEADMLGVLISGLAI